jgi:hypothetical protein
VKSLPKCKEINIVVFIAVNKSHTGRNFRGRVTKATDKEKTSQVEHFVGVAS